MSKIPAIEYKEVGVGELEVESHLTESGVRVVDNVVHDGLRVQPTQRFWNSLCARFGFGPSIFRYFEHDEVFNRISERSEKDLIRLTIQQELGDDEPHPKLPDGSEPPFKPRLLAVSGPEIEGKVGLTAGGVQDAISDLETEPRSVSYHAGLVVTTHECRNNTLWEIGPDAFKTYITLETPIDGYGKPNVFLSLLRQVCTNGMVAYAKAFKSGIILGKQHTASHTLKRALESFSNEDGFIALKQRLESAQKSWASVSEVIRLMKVIHPLKNLDFRRDYALRTVPNGVESPEGTLRNRLLSNISEMSGDIRTLYGVAQIESISEKRMRALPTKCRIADLFNMASEVATHQLLPQPARSVQTFFGNVVSKEYDLEQSGEAFGDFADFQDPFSKPDRAATNN